MLSIPFSSYEIDFVEINVSSLNDFILFQSTRYYRGSLLVEGNSTVYDNYLLFPRVFIIQSHLLDSQNIKLYKNIQNAFINPIYIVPSFIKICSNTSCNLLVYHNRNSFTLVSPYLWYACTINLSKSLFHSMFVWYNFEKKIGIKVAESLGKRLIAEHFDSTQTYKILWKYTRKLKKNMSLTLENYSGQWRSKYM